MTIKEAAALYGVSTQAVYQRIAKHGRKARELVNQETRELTEEGAALLGSWFAISDQQETAQESKSCSHCKELETENAALQAENTSLQTQLSIALADKERLYTLLHQAQQTAQALTVARISAGATKPASTIWERLKGVFFTQEHEKEGE